MDNADIQPEELVLELNNAVNTQALELNRTVGNDSGSPLVSSITDKRIRGGGSELKCRQEVGSSLTTSRGGDLGKQDTGTVTILTSHHGVSGGVVGDSAASFTGEVSVNLVDALVRSMTKGETGRARDAVATIRDQDLRGRVVSTTQVEVTRGGVTRNSNTPGSQEGQEAKIVAGEGDEGSRLNDVGVKPKRTNHHTRLLGTGGDEVSVAGGRGREVTSTDRRGVGSKAEGIPGDKVEDTNNSRLNLLRGGFSKASGRRFRGAREGSRGRGKQANNGGKGGDRPTKRGSKHIVGDISKGSEGKLTTALSKDRVMLGGTDRGQEGGRSKTNNRRLTKATITKGEFSNGVGASLKCGIGTRICMVKALENIKAGFLDHGVEEGSSFRKQGRRGDTGMVVKGTGANLTEEAHGSMRVASNGGETHDGIKPGLEAPDLGEAVVDDSSVSTKEATRDLDSITNNGGKLEERTVRKRVGSIRGQKQLPFTRVTIHTNGVTQGIIHQ
jgi:hypothetical protein